ILAALQRLTHLRLWNALVIAVHDRIFDQFVPLDHARKFRLGNEPVILAVHLILAAFARGGSDNKMERKPARFHALDNGILPNAGRSRNDDKKGIRCTEIECVGHWNIVPKRLRASSSLCADSVKIGL